MNLALTADQQMIRDAAEAFLADASDSAAVRAALASESGHDEAVWRRIGSEFGWCAIAIPEQYSGLGLGAVELALIQEQAGRRLLCSPFFNTVCLRRISCWKSALTPPRSGSCRKSRWAGCARPRHFRTAHGAIPDWRATRAGERWVLAGRAVRVPDAGAADMLVLPAQTDSGEVGLFAVQAGARGMHVELLNTWDATRRFASLDLHEAPAEPADDPARARRATCTPPDCAAVHRRRATRRRAAVS